MTIVIDLFHPQGPADTTALLHRLRQLPRDRIRRLAVLGKTEGTATLNDFSRELAQSAVDNGIKEVGGDALLDRTTRFFSTGCEGIASPITVLLADIEDDETAAGQEHGLVFGTAISSVLADSDRASLKHIEIARQTVLCAIADARLNPDQVALVLIKSPIMSATEAARCGGDRLRHGGSTASSRGAAAIGAGLALGEINPAMLGPDPVGRSPAYSRRVMAFSGTEVDRIEVTAIGCRPGGDPRWNVRSSLVGDLADGDAMRALWEEKSKRPFLVLFKAGIATDGMLRGRRTTVLTSDLPADKQLRAAASGVVATCFGNADAFISAGAEHLGPSGSCLCALILKY